MKQGQRRDLSKGELPTPGQFGLTPNGEWYGCPPVEVDESGFALMANLSAHQVSENNDRTITVSPSILIGALRNSPRQWHGYLENGIWREV